MNHPVAGPSGAHPAMRYEAEREALPASWADALGSASMLDGYLCGVLLQPRPVGEARWWAAWVDAAAEAADPIGNDFAEPRAAPGSRHDPHGPSHPVQRLRPLAVARHAELQAAISQRRWFDPWVFEPGSADDDSGPGADALAGLSDDGDSDDDADMPGSVHQTMYLWAAGFIEAMVRFDDLLELSDTAAAEPQALICQFLERDELEDADALWDMVDTFEPPQTLADAVECVVRATLLLADITRPQPNPAANARPIATPRHRRPGPPINRGGSRRS